MGGPGHRLRYVTGGEFLLSGFVLHPGSVGGFGGTLFLSRPFLPGLFEGADLAGGDTACNLLLLATSTLGHPLVDEILAGDPTGRAVRALGVVLTGNGETVDNGVGFLVLNICVDRSSCAPSLGFHLHFPSGNGRPRRSNIIEFLLVSPLCGSFPAGGAAGKKTA
ncbi:hypothetical protein M413DRAFT_438788 [Hebeloma cylindrosporum]|uniref:Uncharacterized protein n=1 Tax=Hebeloma cylindrosporum TaxID=76867 RepID=A0A0C2Z934_HEBCY|nr:hypothetical protein M413DRAFT_438788 [Hebeloma cylindrosporum h7]